ncbi:hypothetical protein [Winogradskyella aurantiaca]|uniref:hypothetical protein n=1 Tax=Winogradskyella aurantiaca TaxID=2219558 RepID=UPI000E1DCD43|nr:hypothetical protein [Winogradskyella aurantiaca]
MKKIIGYSFLGFLCLSLIFGFISIRNINTNFFKERPAYLQLSHQSKPMNFKWTNNNIEGHIENQSSMLLPVKIGTLEHNLHVQFDTGAPNSYIYEKDLISLRKLGCYIKEIKKNGARFVENLEMELGGQQISLSMIMIYPNYGTNFSTEFNANSTYIIGTIGSDILVDRITSIDFENQELQFFEKRPTWMDEINSFKPFDFPGRRIMLPVTIDGKTYEFLYDSGCSAFGLITTKQRFNKYTDNTAPIVTYDAKSWEDKIHINSKPSDHKFTIADQELPLKRVSYVDMYSMLQPIATVLTRIGGWMGNQSLNESQLILDTQTNQFTVIP